MSVNQQDAPQLPITARGVVLKNEVGFPGSVHLDQQVYFCTLACLHAFENDTDRFMAGEIEHPLDEDTDEK